MPENAMSNVDVEKIKKAVSNNSPLTFATQTVSHDILEKLEAILNLILIEIGEEKIKDQLTYCVRELAENARKANLKRVYFQEKGLNINNYADYIEGIKAFKPDVYGNIDFYFNKLIENDLQVKIIFQTNQDFFIITVKNNVPIIGYELKRIEDRINRSKAFITLEDAFTLVIDDTEGAGLGIVILIQMLKKVGLSEESFTINIEGNETIAKITIPRSDILLDNLDELVSKIVEEIQTLPQFPEHIASLQRLLSNPDSDISEIGRIVSIDPGLTADVLKVVNSAQYYLRYKIKNVNEAIKMIGFRGLKNLLYSYGSQKVLSEKYGLMKELWEHSYKTAFYAYYIARNYSLKSILDDVYVAALLHDLGKVVVEFLHPDFLEHIKTFTIERGMTSDIFERFTVGLQHAEIGARIARKWNFPDQLVATIKYHHAVSDAPDDVEELVAVVYLANSFCNIEDSGLQFEQLSPEILKRYKIAGLTEFAGFHARLKEAFEKEK
jgi:putative nucleotidyltransferase with HDIG domain